MIGWRTLRRSILSPAVVIAATLILTSYAGAMVLDSERDQTIWALAVAWTGFILVCALTWAGRRARRRIAFSLTAEPGLPEGRMKVTLNSSGVLSPVVVLQVLASTLDMMDQVPVSGGSVVLSVDMISEADPSEARDR